MKFPVRVAATMAGMVVLTVIQRVHRDAQQSPSRDRRKQGTAGRPQRRKLLNYTELALAEEMSLEQIGDYLHAVFHSAEPSAVCQSLAYVGGQCTCGAVGSDNLDMDYLVPLSDGAKWLCLDHDVLNPDEGCLVYSFGISYDFSFDLAMEDLGCRVHAFDPTMHQESRVISERVYFHNFGVAGENQVMTFGGAESPYPSQNLYTVDDIVAGLNHSERNIPIVKMDVEGYEWDSLQQQLVEGKPLLRAKQMMVEIHFCGMVDKVLPVAPGLEMIADLDRARRYFSVIRGLQLAGYQQINRHTVGEKPLPDNIRIGTKHFGKAYELLFVKK